MDITRIVARNFRNYEHLDLSIPQGCTAIVGANGAGKSSCLEALDVGLFGARSLDPYVCDRAESTEMEISIYLEHRGASYRIRRGRSIRGGGKTTVSFDEAVVEGEWQPLAGETTKATQEIIEATLGISRTTLSASCYLRQGDGAAFSEAPAAERKAILAEALGLGVYDRLLGLVKADRAGVERSLDLAIAAEQHALMAIEEAGDVPGRLVECRERFAKGERVVAELEVEERQALDVVTRGREQAAAAAAARQIAGARLRELMVAKEAAIGLDIEIGRLEVELDQRDHLASVAALIPTHEAAIADVAAAIQADRDARHARGRELDEGRRLSGEAQVLVEVAQALDRQLVAVQAQRRALDEPAATCDRCGQTVDGDARARAIAQLDDSAEEVAAHLVDARRRAQITGQEAQAARDRAAAIVVADDLSSDELHRAELASARAAAVQLGRLDAIAEQRAAAISRADQLAASIPALEQAHADATASIGDDVSPVWLASREAEARDATAKLAGARRLLNDLHGEIGRLEAAAEQLYRHTTAATTAAADAASLQGQLDTLRILERACSRDGIPALIVENEAIPQLEDTANRILLELGAGVTVELRTQRATKTGDLRDALDIVLQTTTGERPYETFSGGERTRINLALRIALARLLAARRGADVRLLAIDEPEFLDAAGTELLAGVLRGLEGDFTRILLVSHHESLRDAFDQAIVVERDADGWSRIAGAAVLA